MASDMGREFQVTPGGDVQMPLYITLALTSCSTGIYSVPIDGIFGAPPPMIIHSCNSSSSKVEVHSSQLPPFHFYQTAMYSEGLGEPYSVVAQEGGVKKNPWGLCVRCAENFSMKQRTFFDYSIHFVKNLPEGQRKDCEPVILFLEVHSSCWGVILLVFLMKYNVFPFLLPSHTSI